MDNSINEIIKSIDELMPRLKQIRNKLYENPEIGGTECFASGILASELRTHGFAVEENYCGIPYALKGTYRGCKKGAVIGLFAEYDALPEIGHGCGHNLICNASLGAAIALQNIVSKTGGTIIFYGTPGEENLQTKTTMVPIGAFDEADVALMAHPNPVTYASGKTLAIESLQIEFFGQSAHAGVMPEKGRNALDAAVQCYQMIQLEKQYYPNTNVYGIINDGGKKASVIPDYSCLRFLTRARSMDELSSLRRMVESCAESAATATRCTFKITNNETTNHAMLTNKHMSEVFNRYLRLFGETKILYDDMKGSTDMADVSYVLPSIHPWVGLNCPDKLLHSQEFADMTISEEGDRFIERSSKAMACTAYEILTDEKLLNVIRQEFEESIRQECRADQRKEIQ